MRHAFTALFIAALAVAASGCPSANHRIRHEQLASLSQAPPETRGQRIEVVQSLGSGDDPPAPAPHVRAGAGVVVYAPVWIDGRPHHHGHRHGAPSGGSVSHGSGGGSSVAAAKKETGKAWLVVAAVAAGALALTEGIRYDGAVAVHPMHPVHLWGPYGEYTWMPLAHITPEVAQWADRAVIREDEGPWTRLGRRPLDRQGFTYSLLLGSGEIALIGDDPRAGFVSHIQLGFFPHHMAGLQADISYGWGEDAGGATIFDGRYSLELAVLPLAAGRFHAGGYGQVGLAYRSDDGIQHDDQDVLTGVGGLLQLDLTTRLALTLRAGQTWVHDESLSELTFGVSIY